MQKLFLAWQDSVTRSWFPVGSLTYKNNWYEFVYLRGAEEAKNKCGFSGIWSLNEFDKVYRSQELLPVFSHRIMKKTRPDYPDFISWQNLSETEDEPMVLLSRSGGKKVTDNYEIFPYPEQDENGVYHLYFFSHGLRYMASETIEKIKKLEVGETLFLMHDAQNNFDRDALMLRTKDFYLLGFCPRYLLNDVFPLLKKYPDAVKVILERVNLPPAPLQMRLLCHLIVKHDDFQPFSSEMYESLAVPILS
ncbi:MULTISPECIES: HIRAN domain-containing protein [unclassified Okeania]|uniref:HIRAN domain-containing protein n=1 Tax=unclassified Okeania TaxID=2634635 RepID=UPI0013BE37AF|nr:MULTISPECIES: HIRAN domain-containing protein [unclassified Okeania]NES74346.1 DNA-binding protein [Okeania sp. SIO1H4]NET18367.1 DNA-binding protein [Okeania sp. SIO1H5]NET92226.1 DNA-binding protein [Okeania sp. SIO1H2]